MPERTLGNSRPAITRESSATIATNGNLSTRQEIGARTVGSSVTNIPQAPGISQSEIDRINSLIRQNVTKYIDVPWNDAFEGRNLPRRDTNDNVPGLPALPKNPFETLADAFLKGFGGATYNPPLQQQSYGYGTSGGGSLTIILVIVGVAIGGYYLYKRSQ